VKAIVTFSEVTTLPEPVAEHCVQPEPESWHVIVVALLTVQAMLTLAVPLVQVSLPVKVTDAPLSVPVKDRFVLPLSGLGMKKVAWLPLRVMVLVTGPKAD